MTGTIIGRLKREEPHACDPPYANDEPSGTVWRCECGAIFLKVLDRVGSQHFASHAWRQPGWWERRRVLRRMTAPPPSGNLVPNRPTGTPAP